VRCVKVSWSCIIPEPAPKSNSGRSLTISTCIYMFMTCA
jgi:hypothetical protein